MSNTVSATDRDSRLDENHDGPECINCAAPQPEGAKWRKLIVSSVDHQGVMDELESWPLCPDCEISQPARLVDYVKFALS